MPARNEGSVDRIIRLLLGCLLLAASISAGVSTAWGIVAMIGAVAMLITGAIGFCGLYRVLGISTCRTGKHSQTP